MKEKNKNNTDLASRYITMDAKLLDFPDKKFDLILDKGTFDAMSCSEDNLVQLPRVISEAIRVLNDTGTYLIMSYAPPSLRMYQFKNTCKVNCTELFITKAEFPNERESSYWFYTCTKRLESIEDKKKRKGRYRRNTFYS